MTAEPGRPGRRRRCGSPRSPPPAGDRTACPAGTHRVSAVTSPRTASPDPPAILISPQTSIRSLIAFPGNHCDGERQAGRGRAGQTAPSVNAIPGTRRKSPGAGNRASHHPVPAAASAPRSPSPVQPARHTRSPGPSAAGVLPSRFLVTCQVPRRARLPPTRPRCARLPAPAGLSPRCTGRQLRPSRSGRRRAPPRPRTRRQPRQSVLHIRIRAPAAASTSRPMAPAASSDPPRPASAATSQPPSRPCGSRSPSTPNRTSACHPLCVRHGCHLRGIGGMDLLSAR